MKKLITLTVAAMMVLPALAMANRAEDPCPGETYVTPSMADGAQQGESSTRSAMYDITT